MIMATKTNSRRTALWWCLACIACIASPALAKVETGTLKLDSVTTEQLIGRFGVTEKGSLTLKLTTAKKGWERGEHALHILVFRDESYKRWRDMIKKGSLCQERNRLADIEKAVDLPHPLATHAGHGFEYFVDPETGRSYRINLETGDSDWAEPDNHPEGPLNRVEHRETTFTTTLAHHRPKGRGRDVERVPVSAHWYVVVADCRLEFYDAHPPPMKYHLTFLRGDEGERGGTSHLPADLRGVGVLYWTLLVAMVALAVPGRSAIVGQYRRLGRVHALVVGVGVAYALQTASIALELAHLAVFSRDGKGLQWRFTFFAADFAAEVFQGVAELLASLMLLFLACGWTTVSLGTAGARLLGSLESGGGGGSAGSAGAEAEKREDEAGRGKNGRGGGGRGLGREIGDRVPDGVAAVFKGLLRDDDDPRVKARIQSVTRAPQSPARLFARGAAAASSVARGPAVPGAISPGGSGGGEPDVARGVPGGGPRVRADLPGDCRQGVHRRLQRVSRSRALAGIRSVRPAFVSRRALRGWQRQRAPVGRDAGPGRGRVPSRPSRRGVGLDAGVPRARGHRVDAAGDVAASMGDGRVRAVAIDGARRTRVPREHEREVPGGVDRGAEERERRG